MDNSINILTSMLQYQSTIVKELSAINTNLINTYNELVLNNDLQIMTNPNFNDANRINALTRAKKMVEKKL